MPRAARRERERNGGSRGVPSQVVIGEEIVREQHACALARRPERVIGAVEAQAVADIDIFNPGRREPIGPGRNAGSIGQRIVMNERGAGERLRC